MRYSTGGALSPSPANHVSRIQDHSQNSRPTFHVGIALAPITLHPDRVFPKYQDIYKSIISALTAVATNYQKSIDYLYSAEYFRTYMKRRSP